MALNLAFEKSCIHLETYLKAINLIYAVNVMKITESGRNRESQIKLFNSVLHPKLFYRHHVIIMISELVSLKLPVTLYFKGSLLQCNYTLY